MKTLQTTVTVESAERINNVVQQYNEKHFILISITPTWQYEIPPYGEGKVKPSGFLLLFNSTEL